MLAVFGALVSFLMETQLAMRAASVASIVPKSPEHAGACCKSAR